MKYKKKYKILRNDSEKELISNCVIARLEQIKVEDSGQEYTREEVEYQSDKILKEIKRYLFIIDYELEEINHENYKSNILIMKNTIINTINISL